MLWPGNWRRLHRKLCVGRWRRWPSAAASTSWTTSTTPTMGALAGAAVRLRRARHRAAGGRGAGRHGAAVAAHAGDARHPQGPAGRRAGLAARLRRRARCRQPRPRPAPAQPTARAALLLRDNLRNRARIERAYRRAIGRAREEIIIANAYFVPGRRMRHALVTAARRGVKVQLLLQGRYEYFMQYYASRPIYGALLRAGVADPRVLAQLPARQGGGDRRPLGHGGFVQPRSAEPAAGARSQRGGRGRGASPGSCASRLLQAMQHAGRA